VERLVALIDMCRTMRSLPTLAELALEFECSKRTVRRNLDAIELYMSVPMRADQRRAA
jgi:predicted DNA-binding transcriptional regulator YafY